MAVLGLSRNPQPQEGVTPVAADLLDPASVAAALDGLAPTHVFLTTWLRQPTEAENIRVNALMLRNLFDGLRPLGTVRHAALVTGLKHYLGPFEAYGKGSLPKTPFREDQGRLDVANFITRRRMNCSRPRAATASPTASTAPHRHRQGGRERHEHGHHLGRLCRHLPRDRAPVPLSRIGRAVERPDGHDRRPPAGRPGHLGGDHAAAHDQAFNIVNGDVFRWNWMWHRLADWFGVKAEDFDGTERPLADQMADDAAIWARIAEREGLAEPDITRLVSPWHTDADLGRPIEVVTDMSKSRKLGFTAYQATDEAFFDLFEQLEADRIIPRR